MTKKTVTYWFPEKITFDLSKKDYIIFMDRQEGKAIGMKLTQFFTIVDIVKEELKNVK